MKNEAQFTLYYFHDPMCSWCWGFQPAWQKLQQMLPETVTVKYVLGGLASDSQQAMPEALRTMIKNTWLKIHQELGTEFNFDFWVNNIPRRSTYPACRAVIAAHRQGKEKEMILSIQQAYYLRALNPSDVKILQQLAEEIRLNIADFNQALSSDETKATLGKQVTQAEQWHVPGYPSLVLRPEFNEPTVNLQQEKINDLKQLIHIPVNYKSYQKMLADIKSAMKRFQRV